MKQHGTTAERAESLLMLTIAGWNKSMFPPDKQSLVRLDPVWMLEVNGFLMDIRSAPRELQEVAFQKGLIPYIPADRVKSDEDT